jgi:hypothetical protein
LSVAPGQQLREGNWNAYASRTNGHAQALNPKSLVSTTNKLQQIVAEVDRLECFTLRQCDVPVIVERESAALRVELVSARAYST